MGRCRTSQQPDRLLWWMVDLERVVVPLLQVPGVRVWRPSRARYVLFDGLWKPEPVDLLPGYALLGSALPWRSIEEATGVSLLRAPGAARPAPLPYLAVAEFERLESEDGGEVLWQVPAYRDGQRVLVREDVKSSYSGMGGEFCHAVPVRGGWFAEVCLEVVGCVMLPLDHLEPADG